MEWLRQTFVVGVQVSYWLTEDERHGLDFWTAYRLAQARKAEAEEGLTILASVASVSVAVLCWVVL